MDRASHLVLGAFASLGVYGLFKHLKHETPTVKGALGSMVLGGFAALLPDLLEPANNPNHRGFFHSKALLAMLAYGNQKILKSQSLTEDQKLAILLFSVAFGSHLLSDGGSPKGLPLIV